MPKLCKRELSELSDLTKAVLAKFLDENIFLGYYEWTHKLTTNFRLTYSSHLGLNLCLIEIKPFENKAGIVLAELSKTSDEQIFRLHEHALQAYIYKVSELRDSLRSFLEKTEV